MGKLQESTAVGQFLVFDVQLTFGAMRCHDFLQNKSFQLEIPIC